MGNGNRQTPEFRREAVRLALTSGRTRRDIAVEALRRALGARNHAPGLD
jgi:transposase-like protein